MPESQIVIGFDGGEAVAIGEIKDGLLHIGLHDAVTGEELKDAPGQGDIAKALFAAQVRSGKISHTVLAPEIRNAMVFESTILELVCKDTDGYAAPETKFDRAVHKAKEVMGSLNYDVPEPFGYEGVYRKYLAELEIAAHREYGQDLADVLEQREPTPFVEEISEAEEEITAAEADLLNRDRISEHTGYNQAIVDFSADHGYGTPAGKLLSDAAKTIGGKRMTEYGKPERNADVIAEFFSTFLTARLGKIYDPGTGTITLTGSDVASLNVLQKTARQANAPKRDNWLDIAGYAAIGEQCDQERAAGQIVAEGEEEVA